MIVFAINCPKRRPGLVFLDGTLCVQSTQIRIPYVSSYPDPVAIVKNVCLLWNNFFVFILAHYKFIQHKQKTSYLPVCTLPVPVITGSNFDT
jgi:hypothetical protein